MCCVMNGRLRVWNGFFGCLNGYFWQDRWSER